VTALSFLIKDEILPKIWLRQYGHVEYVFRHFHQDTYSNLGAGAENEVSDFSGVSVS
jgi:hypothetical protein